MLSISAMADIDILCENSPSRSFFARNEASFFSVSPAVSVDIFRFRYTTLSLRNPRYAMSAERSFSISDINASPSISNTEQAVLAHIVLGNAAVCAYRFAIPNISPSPIILSIAWLLLAPGDAVAVPERSIPTCFPFVSGESICSPAAMSMISSFSSVRYLSILQSSATPRIAALLSAWRIFCNSNITFFSIRFWFM